jgi:hypothetical protein
VIGVLLSDRAIYFKLSTSVLANYDHSTPIIDL